MINKALEIRLWEVVAPETHGSALVWNIKNCIVRASEGETSNKNNVLSALSSFCSDTCVLVLKIYLRYFALARPAP